MSLPDENLTLIEKLRRIQIEWQLDVLALAKITHTSADLLNQYFAYSKEELLALPSIPDGFGAAVSLVSIYQNLSRSISDSEKQNEWLITPNDAYDGHKPIEVMAMSPAHVAWISYTLVSSVP